MPRRTRDAERTGVGKAEQPVRGGQRKVTARGERAERHIMDTALRLFGERGYDRTTMREIAKVAGVSLGNAYYYFPSKDHLVQEFYARIQREHRERAAGVLASSRTLADRVCGVLHAGIDVMTPYHEFAGSFVKVAIVPASPASPFSAESAPARDASVGLFRDVVAGSGAKLSSELRADLPYLLWLGFLAVTLFWVYDRSPNNGRTRKLISGLGPLLARLVTLTRIPVLRSMIADVLALARSLRA